MLYNVRNATRIFVTFYSYIISPSLVKNVSQHFPETINTFPKKILKKSEFL